MYTREKTKQIRVGKLPLGGGAPIWIQSMTNTKTKDAEATIRQIHALEEAGCEIIRATVPDMESAEAFWKIKENISIPLVADIHFDYRLAIAAVEHGADKIRINPGNIGSEDRIKAVVDNVRLLEQFDFTDIVVSLKASHLNLCADAYLAFAEKYPYPLHLGVTEAGTLFDGAVKSAMGLGIMLHAGIGDTLRVSLTDDPVEEVRTARKILTFAGLRRFGPEFISCPTCGRTSIDLVKLAKQVQEALADLTLPIRIAVMGCVVNGPGEAREADLGIAGGNGEGLIFKKGEILYKVPEDQLLAALVQEARQLEQDAKEES